MGDSRRFDLFAKLINKHIPKTAKIVDVAGGKGYLQAALRQLGYTDITSWDKRHKYAANRKGYRYGYFNWQAKEKYDAVVAMHPDEGTDHAILYAGKNRVPAIVCPCCIKPDATVFNGDHNFKTWCKHLEKLASKNGLEVIWTRLKMQGRSDVLIIRPC